MLLHSIWLFHISQVMLVKYRTHHQTRPSITGHQFSPSSSPSLRRRLFFVVLLLSDHDGSSAADHEKGVACDPDPWIDFLGKPYISCENGWFSLRPIHWWYGMVGAAQEHWEDYKSWDRNGTFDENYVATKKLVAEWNTILAKGLKLFEACSINGFNLPTEIENTLFHVWSAVFFANH